MGRKFKKRLVEKVEIIDLGDRGKGIAKDPSGQVIFVEEKVAPGDIVDILVYKKRKGSLLGTVTEIHEFSKNRVEPFCQHFGSCGGCKFQHISYEEQLAYKQRVVANALLRIGKIEIQDFQPILGVQKSTYYRNKLEFSFSNKKWLSREQLNDSEISNTENVLGFHGPGTWDKVVDIEHCYLQEAPSNDLRNAAREIAKEQNLSFHDARAHEGFLRNMVVRLATTGEMMMIVSFHEYDKTKIDNFLNALLEKIPQLTSVFYCINDKLNDSLADREMIHFFGKKWMEEKLGEVKFKIGPKSFFQTNSYQTTGLYDTVKDFAELSGKENVYDLYTGLGSIGLYLAEQCKQVVGIEEVEAAIQDAKENARFNDIENAVFYAGDVKDILTTNFSKKHGKPDVVITDPPRNGMHKQVVEMLLELAAPKIVYVSCKPSTQARDLNILKEKYDVVKVRPVDMFPHTHHIETVALLKLRM